MRFPTRARVVAWGRHPSASIEDPGTDAMLTPLREAGFRVDEVFTPSEALALLARTGRAWPDGPERRGWR